mmetsp:Transcript_1365/g.2789  ORF Transcript_1365/g.2789 Transcript_1365/m.2789 type:complete len:83 (-) Transcript_1365:213-461(-)
MSRLHKSWLKRAASQARFARGPFEERNAHQTASPTDATPKKNESHALVQESRVLSGTNVRPIEPCVHTELKRLVEGARRARV